MHGSIETKSSRICSVLHKTRSARRMHVSCILRSNCRRQRGSSLELSQNHGSRKSASQGRLYLSFRCRAMRCEVHGGALEKMALTCSFSISRLAFLTAGTYQPQLRSGVWSKTSKLRLHHPREEA